EVGHRNLTSGQAEDGPCAEGAERDLNAALAALVSDHGWGGVEPADQSLVDVRRLGGVGMGGDGQRLVGREDQSQVGRGQAPVDHRADSGLAEAGVPRHIGVERGCGYAMDRLRDLAHRYSCNYPLGARSAMVAVIEMSRDDGLNSRWHLLHEGQAHDGAAPYELRGWRDRVVG